ncbi:c-type cytochrome [Cesiribacter andamanensis]|uniref:Alcohol dehydrogenase cytochrome c subunit n=1 Tax=Cesiribacter andamanensis AMV16 TaxID=1279009 RepID=M7NJH5_9BACT|nr:c-type cytochrome [Cesiribacter andamanensis]EMR01950.1 Alcohol dehydrogenase cytochrome c subunit precursor [Cesiribacter andamanensis AMV16]
MIRKLFRGAAIFLCGLLGLAVLLLAIAYGRLEWQKQQVYRVPVAPLQIPGDSAILARGAHLAAIKGCAECHGEDGGGKIMLDDPALGLLVGSNLTRGRGGLPAAYTTTDWVRALKHGLRQDGRPLLLMPSQETSQLSAEDMAALIAYYNALPAVDREQPPMAIGPVLRLLSLAGQVPLFPAQQIDHERPLLASVAVQVGPAYGEYLAISCSGCHGTSMKGMDAPAPGLPARPDISRSGKPGRWTQEQFIETLRTGQTPDGRQLKQEDMPWQMTARYTDEELQSLYLYLMSI